MGHVLAENRNGLIVDTEVTLAGGREEWMAGLAMLGRRTGRRRRAVGEPFGWMKTHGLLGKLRHRGLANAAWQFRLAATAYNIMRLGGGGLVAH